MKYPELRKLMVSMDKPMTREDVAKIIGKSSGAVSEKLNGKIDFKLREVFALTAHFRKIKPELTSDIIFSDVEVLTKVTNEPKPV